MNAKHEIIESAKTPWAFCTVCFRDISFNRRRHYTTSAKTIAARKAAAEVA